MVNCHYYVIKWYAKQNGLDSDYIEQYIDNRENILNMISDDRDYSKKVMLKLLQIELQQLNNLLVILSVSFNL
jgi:hypothetical protein